MSDLEQFLLERIAEDESSARELADFDGIGEWAFERHERDLVWMVSSPAGVQIITGYVGNGDSRPAAEHIARWDPARVLVECEAKRAIVAEHATTRVDPNDKLMLPGYCRMCVGETGWPIRTHQVGVGVDAPCLTVRLLALSYAGHPEYDEAWRP